MTYIRPEGKNRFQKRSASLGTLPSAWLDQEINAIYNDLNSFQTSATINASEWAILTGTYTYVSSTTFTANGDLTTDFEAGRAIRITDENETTGASHIQSSSYDSGTQLTTVVLYDSIVPNTIAKVELGFLSEVASALPKTHSVIKNINYTLGQYDQIVFVDDANASTEMWEDGGIGSVGSGKLSILITLPQPSALKDRVVAIKKIAGVKQTIISSAFTHSTSYNADNELVHTYTYDFQILGDTTSKNRITLKGIGDCVFLASNGTNWYELTPEASETVKGIVRIAKSSEMTLTAQQIADGETLRKDLAVSPFEVDKEYLRTNASNMRFASNFIYQAPNGVVEIADNSLLIHSRLGLNIPDGRDGEGILQNTQLELASDIVYNPVEVSDKLKLLFITSSGSAFPILAKNYFMGYNQPTNINATLGDIILWFDLGANLIKESTDNGSNWTTWDGAGPIAQYYGNGANVTNILPYAQVGFLTRDNLQNVYQTAIDNLEPDYSAPVSVSSGSFTAPVAGWILATRSGASDNFRITVIIDGTTYFDNGTGQFNWGTNVSLYVPKGKEITINLYATAVAKFVPIKGDAK